MFPSQFPDKLLGAGVDRGLSFSARLAVEMETPARAAMSSRRVERRIMLQTLLQILLIRQEWKWRLSDDPARPRACCSPDASPALAAPISISSPDGVLTVAVDVNGEGRPEYSVSRLGTPVILPSRLGFLLTDAPKLERNFAIAEAGRRSTDQRWEQPWGERRFVRDRHNELRVRLTEKVAPGRSMDVVFRVFDDGVGFRYEFPAALGQVNIAERITEFASLARHRLVDPCLPMEPRGISLQQDQLTESASRKRR
jgi:hypothetical protein